MSPGTTAPQNELTAIARRAMREHGLDPDFPPAALAQLRAIAGPAATTGGQFRDLRALLWCSIDNDESRDLDQLSVAEALAGGSTRVLVAIADVDATVAAGSPLDAHASANTASVYTAAQVFPMLPERLSTDLTSLADGEERSSLVIDMTVTGEGAVSASDVYRARVVNRAKLAYNSVAAWLDGKGPVPPPVAAVKGMDEQLRLQDRVAQALKRVRKAQGALGLTTLEAQAVYEGGALGSPARRGQPRQGAHRVLHDRRQRRGGAVPRGEALAVAAPRAARARALGTHRRARWHAHWARLYRTTRMPGR